MSELLPDPLGSDTAEWIELRNVGHSAVDIGGLRIVAGSKTYVLPKGMPEQMILASGAFLLLPASMSKLTLVNAGSAVRLMTASGVILDELTYPAIPEGVSWGHDARGAIQQPYCQVSPNAPNMVVSPQSRIRIQSDIVTTARRTVNFEAQVGSSPGGYHCRWEFGDGTSSESCNPAAHVFTATGAYQITLDTRNYCGNTVLQTLNIYPLQKSKSAGHCAPQSFTGVSLSEIFIKPDENGEEWIELRNTSLEPVELCGWSIVDGEGGSRPYRLDAYHIEPESFLLLPASLTHLALNDTGDTVRLGAPLPSGGTGIILSARYDYGEVGASYVWTMEGFVRSVLPTPGYGNVLHALRSALDQPHIIVRAVLPNPVGTDTGQEWMEIENLSGRPQWLNGWSLQSGRTRLSLQGHVLAAGESRRFYESGGLLLRNATGSVKLTGPDGSTISLLAWENPAQGEVIRPLQGKSRLAGRILRVEDGRISVQVDKQRGERRIVRLRGILPIVGIFKSSSEKMYDNRVLALTENKVVDLYLYSDDQVDVWIDGRNIAYLLLQEGYAMLDRQAFEETHSAVTYQQEAISNRRGFWSNPIVLERQVVRIETWKVERALGKKPLTLSLNHKSGIVISGSHLQLKASMPSRYFISLNDQPFQESSGSIILLADTKVRAYAVPILANNRAKIEYASSVVRADFVVSKDFYAPDIAVTELYPSPKTADGEQEWIELYNASEQRVSLGGWMLKKGTGKPKVLPLSLGIDPGSYIMLPSKFTGLKLKNAGDEFELLSPNGKTVQRVRYPSIRNGMSYTIGSALLGNETSNCLTIAPTPGEANTCIAPVAKVKKAKAVKKPTAKKIRVSSKVAKEADLLKRLSQQRVEARVVSLEQRESSALSTGIIGLLLMVCILLGYLALRRLPIGPKPTIYKNSKI